MTEYIDREALHTAFEDKPCYQCYLTRETASEQDFERRDIRNCPLTEVPTPHGRLIDADALLSVAEPIEDRRGNVKRVVWDAHINRRPTVIEAEE